MHFEQAQIDILNWLTGFVEQPNPNLNDWPPCPYARRARLNSEFEIRPGKVDPYTDLQIDNLGDNTVVAYVYDPKEFTAAEFNQQIKLVNQNFLLSRNIVALADHPDDVEEVKGVIMNQGTWAIVFLQPLDKLNHFAKLIADKGYYEGWPEEYLESIFEFRQDPRL